MMGLPHTEGTLEPSLSISQQEIFWFKRSIFLWPVCSNNLNTDHSITVYLQKYYTTEWWQLGCEVPSSTQSRPDQTWASGISLFYLLSSTHYQLLFIQCVTQYTHLIWSFIATFVRIQVNNIWATLYDFDCCTFNLKSIEKF